MGNVVPDAPAHVPPGLHQLPGHRDQLPGKAGSGIPDDPVVGIAALQAAGFQDLLPDEGRHGLIGPVVQQVQDLVRHPLPGAALDHIGRQLGHAVRQNLNAAVHGAEETGLLARGTAAGDGQPGRRHRLHRDGLPGGRPGGGGPQALNHAHVSSLLSPSTSRTTPAASSTPAAMNPAGG